MWIPKDGDRAILIWYGGQATPVIGSWDHKTWVHSGLCHSPPDKLIPLKQALAAPELHVSCRELIEAITGEGLVVDGPNTSDMEREVDRRITRAKAALSKATT